MRIQIITLAIASTLAVQVAVTGYERGIPRYEVPRWENHPVDLNYVRYDNRNNQRVNGSGHWEQRVNNSRRDKQNHDSHFLIRETAGAGTYETVQGFVVKNEKPKEKSGNDKAVPWITTVTDITETSNIPFEVEVSEKIKEDKKEEEALDAIVKKDIELLKMVENIESQPLSPEQAQRAAVIEEKLIEKINKDEKKIADIKADEKNLQNLKTITTEASKINEEMTKEAEAEKKDVPINPVTAEFDRKMQLNLALEQAQTKILPALLTQLKQELKLENENQSQIAINLVDTLGAQLRLPEVKKIIENQPLNPATPIAEKITLIVQKSQRDRKGTANIVGANN